MVDQMNCSPCVYDAVASVSLQYIIELDDELFQDWNRPGNKWLPSLTLFNPFKEMLHVVEYRWCPGGKSHIFEHSSFGECSDDAEYYTQAIDEVDYRVPNEILVNKSVRILRLSSYGIYSNRGRLAAYGLLPESLRQITRNRESYMHGSISSILIWPWYPRQMYEACWDLHNDLSCLSSMWWVC